MGRRNHNRRHIEKWLVNFDRMFPSAVGFISVEEMEGKPSSRPPIPERAWEYMDEPSNREAALYLRPVLEDLRRENFPLYYVVGLVAGWNTQRLEDEEPDHGILRRWRAGETEDDRAKAAMFERAVTWLEERLNDRHPNLWIEVKVPRLEEAADSKRGAAYQERRWGTEDTYRAIDAEITRIAGEEECTIEAAIGLYQDRLKRAKKPDVSTRKIKMARAFVRNEKEVERIKREKNVSVETALDFYQNRIEHKKAQNE